MLHLSSQGQSLSHVRRKVLSSSVFRLAPTETTRIGSVLKGHSAAGRLTLSLSSNLLIAAPVLPSCVLFRIHCSIAQLVCQNHAIRCASRIEASIIYASASRDNFDRAIARTVVLSKTMAAGWEPVDAASQQHTKTLLIEFKSARRMPPVNEMLCQWGRIVHDFKTG